MTAHPKLCPTTGELLFFGYRLRPPYVTLHRATADGELVASAPITLPAATMLHDFAITATRVVLMDSPLVFDPAAAAAGGGSPWRWDDGHGARFGVLPRAALGAGAAAADRAADAQVRWCAVEPCHLSHVLNAHDDGDRVVVTGTRLPRATGSSFGTGLPVLHRWTIDPGSGRVDQEPLDDAPSEYPRLDDARVGLPHRFGYTTSFELVAEPDRSEVHKYDLARGAGRTTHRLPRGHTCGEPVFVPRSARSARSAPSPGSRPEDDGYLLTFAHDRTGGTSYLLILDAADVAGPPVAEVHLPVRVPAGFHGTWLPAGGEP